MTPEQIQEAVKKGVEEDQRKKFDPYRSAIVFLAGLLAFCLTIIVGIFAIMPDFEKWQGKAVAPMVGGVLAWISLAALAATVAMFVVQLFKARHFRRINEREVTWRNTWLQVVAMVSPIFLGGVAVNYCLRGGVAIMEMASAATVAADTAKPGETATAAVTVAFPTLLEALCKLF